MTWEGHADKISVPYLCVAGEFDELSPIEHSVRLVKAVKGPKRMVVYQESRHSVGNVPAANLGPFPPILVADWLADRLAGKPFRERALVRARQAARSTRSHSDNSESIWARISSRQAGKAILRS